MILGYPHDKTETSIWDLGIFLQGPGNSVRTKWDSTRHQKIPQLDQMASTMEAGENQRYQKDSKGTQGGPTRWPELMLFRVSFHHQPWLLSFNISSTQLNSIIFSESHPRPVPSRASASVPPAATPSSPGPTAVHPSKTPRPQRGETAWVDRAEWW